MYLIWIYTTGVHWKLSNSQQKTYIFNYITNEHFLAVSKVTVGYTLPSLGLPQSCRKAHSVTESSEREQRREKGQSCSSLAAQPHSSTASFKTQRHGALLTTSHTIPLHKQHLFTVFPWDFFFSTTNSLCFYARPRVALKTGCDGEKRHKFVTPAAPGEVWGLLSAAVPWWWAPAAAAAVVGDGSRRGQREPSGGAGMRERVQHQRPSYGLQWELQ